MAKLFSEYSQLDARANRHIEGTGLGLSITKHLVDLMGGSISAESEYGEGSSFRVDIAQRIVDESPLGSEAVENLKSLRFMENSRSKGKKLVRAYLPYGRVLVVDDVQTNLSVARGLLLPYGLTIDCVSSGREAIEKIRAVNDDDPAEKKYDIVFMDHMMPEMDGVEATRIIRGEIGTEYARTAPIIALTANALSGNRDMFLSNGFDEFISKPIDIMQLDAALNRWVRDRRSEDTLTRAERDRPPENTPDGDDAAATGILKDIFVDGLDIASGILRYGNETTYLQILRFYVHYTPELLDRLNELSEDEKFLPDYAIAVHGLKGSCYGICADNVGKLAEKLEASAKSGDFETVRANHEVLSRAANALVADLENLLQTADARASNETAKKRASAPDREMLGKMLSAATFGKTSLMEDIMADLERYEYESDGERVVWMREQMDNLEYGAIRERLQQWIS
jgi:CheY-like chemotaxis protein/HPt (histidine-containing phosphotransfer) domain-containing protein